MNDGLQHNDQASAQFACPCGACQSYYIDQIHRADALALHLMEGGKPETYGERLAQMQLQMEGLLTKD